MNTKKITNDAEFKNLVAQSMACNRYVYTLSNASNRKLGYITREIAKYRKIYAKSGKKMKISSKDTNEQELINTAIAFENLHQNSMKYAQKRNISIIELNELISASEYMHWFD